MLNRCTASLALLTGALVAAGGIAPAPASAASIVSEAMVNGVDTIVPNGTPGSTEYAYYTLTNTNPTPFSGYVGFQVGPSGSFLTTGPSLPFTVVGGSTGFNFQDGALAWVSTPGTAQNPQLLAIDFSTNETTVTPPYTNPLAAGGVANFKLAIDPSFNLTAPPTLTLFPVDGSPSPTGLTLMSYTPAYANAAPGAMAVANTPEPVSLALWSTLLGAGVLRARAFRRSRRAA